MIYPSLVALSVNTTRSDDMTPHQNFNDESNLLNSTERVPSLNVPRRCVVPAARASNAGKTFIGLRGMRSIIPLDPVHHPQPLYPLKLAHIVRHQHQPQAARMPGNHGVIGADR